MVFVREGSIIVVPRDYEKHGDVIRAILREAFSNGALLLTLEPAIVYTSKGDIPLDICIPPFSLVISVPEDGTSGNCGSRSTIIIKKLESCSGARIYLAKKGFWVKACKVHANACDPNMIDHIIYEVTNFILKDDTKEKAICLKLDDKSCLLELQENVCEPIVAREKTLCIKRLKQAVVKQIVPVDTSHLLVYGITDHIEYTNENYMNALSKAITEPYRGSSALTYGLIDGVLNELISVNSKLKYVYINYVNWFKPFIKTIIYRWIIWVFCV